MFPFDFGWSSRLPFDFCMGHVCFDLDGTFQIPSLQCRCDFRRSFEIVNTFAHYLFDSLMELTFSIILNGAYISPSIRFVSAISH